MVSQDIPHNVNFVTLIVCLVLAILFVAARTIVRWKKEHTIQAEDYLCWLALASFVSLVGLYFNILDTIYIVTAVASGKAKPTATFVSDGNHMMRCMFAIQLLFWMSLYAVKFSLLFLFRRLALGLPLYEKIWTGVVVFTMLSFIGSVITELTSCTPLIAYFHFGECNKPSDAKAQATSLYFSLAVDVLTDLLIMAIPVRLLWNLQISRLEKMSVALVMCVGVITMVCAIVRASSLGIFASSGQIPISWLVLWACIEGLVAIIVNCLPAFAIIVRSQIQTIRSTGNNSNGHYTHNTLPSQQKSRIRAESMLLDDVGPVEVGRKSLSSHNGSESWAQHHDLDNRNKGMAM
ncbi:hypothetical protein O988_00891 [Pseudogymnoascus sp. VKM F-3808]|nr:hypothetical protein O988_00891 [Pseudogymnoascus sp. VKM F-3808]